MTEAERRFQLQKLGLEIAELTTKYKNIGIFGIVVDDEFFHIFGNICPNCAVEQCVDWLEKENLNHPHAEELEKLINSQNNDKRKVN